MNLKSFLILIFGSNLYCNSFKLVSIYLLKNPDNTNSNQSNKVIKFILRSDPNIKNGTNTLKQQAKEVEILLYLSNLNATHNDHKGTKNFKIRVVIAHINNLPFDFDEQSRKNQISNLSNNTERARSLEMPVSMI